MTHRKVSTRIKPLCVTPALAMQQNGRQRTCSQSHQELQRVEPKGR